MAEITVRWQPCDEPATAGSGPVAPGGQVLECGVDQHDPRGRALRPPARPAPAGEGCATRSAGPVGRVVAGPAASSRRLHAQGLAQHLRVRSAGALCPTDPDLQLQALGDTGRPGLPGEPHSPETLHEGGRSAPGAPAAGHEVTTSPASSGALVSRECWPRRSSGRFSSSSVWRSRPGESPRPGPRTRRSYPGCWGRWGAGGGESPGVLGGAGAGSAGSS